MLLKIMKINVESKNRLSNIILKWKSILVQKFERKHFNLPSTLKLKLVSLERQNISTYTVEWKTAFPQ